MKFNKMNLLHPSNGSKSPSLPALTLCLLVILPHLSTATGLGNETDRIALLAIKSQLIDHPWGVLSSWNSTIHHCYWKGVTCGLEHRRVTTLDLNSRGLSGTISPFIGNMSFLEQLFLYNNSLHGQIPPEVGNLVRLRILNLSNNTIVGQIPANLSSCINLQELLLEYNNLEGILPRGLGSLSKLMMFYVAHNSLTGPLFDVIGNLTSLEYICCNENAFTGTIHDNIGRMKNLEFLVIGGNELTGTLPPSIFNLSSLQTLGLNLNRLQGSLPPDIGFTLPRLESLNLDQNYLSGPIPISIQNLTSLEVFVISNNKFTGIIPLDFGHLPKLNLIMLNSNNLGGDLNFIDTLVNCSNLGRLELGRNDFTGILPTSLANLSTTLSGLGMGNNQISGEIPVGIGNLINLQFLFMQSNKFSGTIPLDIGKLNFLERMNFGSNRLTGSVPNSFGNLSHLSNLYLGGNNLQGSIPPKIGHCQNLLYLHLSHNDLNGTLPNELFGGSAKFVVIDLASNRLEGSIPLEISKQTNLGWLDVSKNKLSGEIPSGLGTCSALLYLNMAGNIFHGNIPPSFNNLGSLQTIDLSHNSLSGMIPDNFSVFPLVNLSLSYNDFEGRVPTTGVFANVSALSLLGNTKLCGGIAALHIPRCMETHSKKIRMHLVLKLTIPIICALVVWVTIAVWLYLTCQRNKGKAIASDSLVSKSFLKVSYNMLLKATNGFSLENLLGTGSFGCVYKGTLEPDGKTIAVKVLDLQCLGASKSFLAECSALRNIRHRNLVGIVTACSSIDFQGNDFKALIYEFMPNGSLEGWLHKVGNLTLAQRVDIAIDVASALDYLHHSCEIPVVHCDLKPSNILLDDDMVAHVGDYGSTKFLSQHLNLHDSNSVGIRGTIGYAAPEYGLGSEASTNCDIYSFGILLLELMTGKRPTDHMFKDDFSLHMYSKAALPDPDQVLQIVDPRLAENENDETNDDRRPKQATAEERAKCMVSVVMIGVESSNPSPRHRMKIIDALSELRQVRGFISNGTHKHQA